MTVTVVKVCSDCGANLVGGVCAPCTILQKDLEIRRLQERIVRQNNVLGDLRTTANQLLSRCDVAEKQAIAMRKEVERLKNIIVDAYDGDPDGLFDEAERAYREGLVQSE